MVVVSACAPASDADGSPDFDNSALPNFPGNNGGSPSNPAAPNGGSNAGYVSPGNTNGGSENNQTGGTPINNGTGSSPSSGTGGSTAAGTAGTNSVPPNNSGGGGGQGTTPPLTPPPEPPGDAFFFDDFEAGTVGQQPGQWARWINYSDNAGNTAADTQFALVDDQDSFAGDKSVHFRVREGNMPAMLTLALPAQSNTIYLRAYVKTSIQVGGVAADQVSNHETMLGLRGTHNDGNFEIRFGGAKGALGFNIVGPGRNDAVAPPQALWGSQPSLSANNWHCVELAFLNQNAASPVARSSVNGTVVRNTAAIGDWHVGLTQQWLDGMFVEAIIGWQSFSPAPANDVWMDDVVLSNSPIGCE